MLLPIVALLAGTAIPVAMDPTEIPHYRVLRSNLAVGGQPTAQGLRRLKSEGLHGVVDLRAGAEGAATIGRIARDLKLSYAWIPADPATFNRANALTLAMLLDNPAGPPLLIVESAGDQAGAVWAVLQFWAGEPADQALEKGRQAGLASEAMVAAVETIFQCPGGRQADCPGGRADDAYDQPPRMIENVRPQYPSDAFSKKIEGTVELEILIDATGAVTQARIVKSIPLLDRAAVKCVFQWRFSPARKNGQSVATRANAPITFRIFDKPIKN